MAVRLAVALFHCYSRARVRPAIRVNSGQFCRSFSDAAAAALREREQAPPLSLLQNFRSIVDDPVAPPGAGNSSIGGRADRPSSIVAPNPPTPFH